VARPNSREKFGFCPFMLQNARFVSSGQVGHGQLLAALGDRQRTSRLRFSSCALSSSEDRLGRRIGDWRVRTFECALRLAMANFRVS
jgi:hypothetical protein